MREVANFMQMYPAYKLRDVLNEYAISIFTLLNEGYRQRFRHYRMLAQLTLLPNVKPRDRQHFFKELEWASSDPSDILKSSSRGSNDKDIEKLLRG